MEKFGTAAILAGGRSTRMGFDKQLLNIGEQRLAAVLLSKLRACFNDVIVVTKDPGLYCGMSVRTVQDIIPDRGPLSGIHAALSITRSTYVYAIACDMPHFDPAYCAYMCDQLDKQQADACVTRFGEWIEPFHAFYGIGLLPHMRENLFSNKTSVHRFLYEQNTLFIPESDARAYSRDWSLFLNLNTREKYDAYLAEQGESV